MSLACSLALAATVYKWVDEDGVIHYSDQPHPNAEKVQVQDAQTYSRPVDAGARRAQPARLAAGGTARGRLRRLRDRAARRQSELSRMSTPLTIVVQTDPALQPGDQIFRACSTARRSTTRQPVGSQFTLSPGRSRHAHAAGGRCSDGTGAVICQTPSRDLQRAASPRLLNPVNPHPAALRRARCAYAPPQARRGSLMALEHGRPVGAFALRPGGSARCALHRHRHARRAAVPDLRQRRRAGSARLQPEEGARPTLRRFSARRRMA